MPKIRNVAQDMEDRNCSLTFLAEIWQKEHSKRHNFKITELFELKGITYISTPRSLRAGGGAAICARDEMFTLTKLNVTIPRKLEIVWGLLKPKEIIGKITKIIVCCFYCPPNSKKKTALIEHMTMTLHSLRSTFPNAGVIVSGDRNSLAIGKLLSIDSQLKQIVTKNTRGSSLLTVVITDLQCYYEEPYIVPPIDVDNPENGVPSDHNGVVVAPIRDKLKRPKYVKTIQPMPASSILNIGKVFTSETWDFMDPNLSPTDLTELYEYCTILVKLSTLFVQESK